MVGSVQLPTVAMPLAFVACVGVVMLPALAEIANVTGTPVAGLPLASLTITVGAAATALFTVACSVVDDCDWIVAAGPAVSAIDCALAEVSPVAVKLSV